MRNLLSKLPAMNLIVSSGKMAFATFISRILGLVREIVMAKIFGATGLTDAFLVAYRIPNMLRDLFAEGAFSSAFVPVFTKVNQNGKADANNLLWGMFILLLSITAFLSLLIAIFAPTIVIWITDKRFYSDPEVFELTVLMTRIMAPFLVMVSLAALFMGVLNTLKIFFVPSLAPAFYNIVIIISMLYMPQLLEGYLHPVVSMAIGASLGGMAQMLVQVPRLFKAGFRPVVPKNIFNANAKTIINRLGLGTIGIAATQINVFVSTLLATGTQIGAVSWLLYGFRLFQFPVGILGVSIGGSNLVHFADSYRAGKIDEAKQTLSSSYLISLMVMLPSLALLYALSTESVHLLLEGGKFDSHSTQMASLALRCYLMGLPFYGLYKIFAPTFYVLDKPSLPIAISISSVGLNILFCIWATPRWGFHMLAIGTTLSMLFNAILQGYFLIKLLNLKVNFFLNLRVSKLVFAMAATLFFTQYLSNHFFHFDEKFSLKLISFCWIGLAGTFFYLGLILLLGEFSAIKKILKREKVIKI